MNFLFKIITKITFLGKLVEKLGSKVPIIFIFFFLIFIAFYIPYEYENILEFTEKYPNDNIGFTLNLLSPIITGSIIILVFGVVLNKFILKKKYPRNTIMLADQFFSQLHLLM